MARLWSSGAELQSTTSGVEFNTVTRATIDTTIKRSGAASIKAAPSATTAFILHQFQTDAINTVFFRFYLRIGTLPGANIAIFQYRDSSNGEQYDLVLSTTGTLWMGNGSTTQIGGSSASSALNLNQWYRVEVKVVDDAGSAAQMEFKVDGTTISTATGLVGLSGGGRIALGALTGTSSPVLYFDDIAVNDTSGSAQTGYPGDGKIVHMRPDGAGDNAGWSDGDGGGGANYAKVDEVTPDDATTYVKRTSGQPIDDHNVQSSSSAGIGSGDSVTLVHVSLRGKATSNTANAGRNITTRIKSASGGTVQSGNNADFSQTAWVTDVDNANGIHVPQLTSYVDPTTGVAWTPTGTNSLDNMQIGYTPGNSSTTEVDVSTVWALVEYIPAAPATPKSGFFMLMG